MALPATTSALVILPTYQEAANIELVLRKIREVAPQVSILVVDDASPDGTAELAGQVAAALGQIDILHRPRKSGLGSAYCAGFAWGLDRGFTVLVEMDADLSHAPADLGRLLDAIAGGADLAIGSRYVSGGETVGWSRGRRAISIVGNRYASAMLGVPAADVTAGFRAYRSDLLRRIDLGLVRSNGYGFQIEMAYLTHGLGGTVVEVPIRFSERSRGTSKMSLGIVAEALGLVTIWGVRRRFTAVWPSATVARSVSREPDPSSPRH